MRRSFGIWLILIFAVSIFAPLAVFSGILAQYFNRMFVIETESTFENTLVLVSRYIATYTAELGRLSMTPYFHQDIMDSLLDINSGKYFSSSAVAVKVNRNFHAAFSQQFATSRNDVVSVFFAPYDLNQDIGFLVMRFSGGLQIVYGTGAKESDWYNSAVKADGAVSFAQSEIPGYLSKPNSHYFFTNERLNTFSVVRLIKDTNTMRPIGVIKIDATDEVICDIFENIPVAQRSMLALLDQSDRVIFSDANVEPELIEAAAAGVSVVAGESDIFHISTAPIAETPWKLFYFVSENDIRQRTNAIFLATALFGTGVFIVAILIFYNSSLRTVRAMNQLLREMKKIASGDLDIKLNIRKGGYLSTIADALTQMARLLDNHIQNEYKAVLNQRNAEYLALQSQINPHFLSNILSTFVTLNRIGNRDTLEQAILKLSHLFRYVAKNENLSTVHGEMAFLNEYLDLQQLRFSEKLSFDLSYAPETKHITIPKLLLQPLVENAIVHGMEPFGRHININVSATLETRDGQQYLAVAISDNGGGFNTDTIGSDSVGLANIIERLELFDSRSVFKIESSYGSGCLCKIALPVHEGDAVC